MKNVLFLHKKNMETTQNEFRVGKKLVPRVLLYNTVELSFMLEKKIII